MPVEPTRSAKSTVTTRRSSAITKGPWSGPAVSAHWTISICSRGFHTLRREGDEEAPALTHSAQKSLDGHGDPDRGGASLQVATPSVRVVVTRRLGGPTASTSCEGRAIHVARQNAWAVVLGLTFTVSQALGPAMGGLLL